MYSNVKQRSEEVTKAQWLTVDSSSVKTEHNTFTTTTYNLYIRCVVRVDKSPIQRMILRRCHENKHHDRCMFHNTRV